LIDPRAVIDTDAVIADGVRIGPFAVIGPGVEIRSGCWIGPHVVINGPTTIGRDNQIFQFCSIGEAPQDLKYNGEPTRLTIGDRNTFREYCTINRGTVTGHGETVIGSDNLIMAYVHVAHDCVVGDHTVFSNGASLAGHVTIGDHAILGGFTLVHQFSQLGAHSFTGMGTALNRDLPPFTIASGNYAHAVGINKEGLKRRGFTPETIRALSQAFKLLVKGKDRTAAMQAVAELAEQFPEVKTFVDFIENSERGIVR
jgi:UDP-N-acetylglucosamine acyltransferase